MTGLLILLIFLDAVYHTSIVFGNVEYMFGSGIQTAYPGSTHHGKPMEVVSLGKTSLPLEVIMEYLESLKQVYTHESYDLFAHNCNNFSNDFAMFLVGRGIPEHITSLPQTVLNTPFGQMLKPQLDREMRSITQASVPASSIPPKPVVASASSSTAAMPPHPHDRLNLPLFKRTSTKAVTYNKVPPMDKLIGKMGDFGNQPEVNSAVDFVKVRNHDGAKEAPLPDMPALGSFFRKSVDTLPIDVLFTAYDLARLVVADPRASGYFAQEADCQTFLRMLSHVNALQDIPYNLRLVALHMSCNMFNSPVFEHLLHTNEKVTSAMVTLISNSLLDEGHSSLRVAAASLSYNLTTALYRTRTTQEANADSFGTSGFPDGLQVELAASLIEALPAEKESAEAIKGLVVSLGRLAYRAEKGSEVLDLYRAMDASSVVEKSRGTASQEDRGLIMEIAKELLTKGL